MLERGLYIVPTPIGNLSDITQRAISTLADADIVAAEDTRHSRGLLAHLDIEARLVSYNEHATGQVAEDLVDHIRAGASVALISDAGTPLVSDPGYRLVRAVQEAGEPVVPLPGPCAAITALSASGLPTHSFTFEGFLPAKASQRRKRLETLKATEGTLVFFEAPHRIADCLADAVDILGASREAALGRELTKAFETLRRMPLGEMAEWVAGDSNQQRGELVLMVAPGPTAANDINPAAEQLLRRLARELPPRRAASVVADVTGIKARSLYQWLLQSEDGGD